MYQGYRASDAIVTICQDNAAKSVEVREINKPAESMLGYDSAAASGKPLMDFLPTRIRSLLKEYVEYDDEGNDVGMVLSKLHSFCLLDSKQREIGFKLKVVRAESPDRNAWFRLILQGKSYDRQEEAFRALLRENFKGHEVLEPHTGLPDRNSMVKNLELTHYYIVKETLKSCFAVLTLDDSERLEENLRYAVLKHIAMLSRQNLRADDAVGCIGATELGVILMDTTPESARMVLNRLRWLVAANPYTLPDGGQMPLTVSICFAQVTAESVVKDIMPRVEARLQQAQAGGGNVLVQV